MREIQYILFAKVDGVTVFRGYYEDTSGVEEDGLRKAEHAVEQALEEIEGENE